MSQILSTIATVPDQTAGYVMHLVTMQSPDRMNEITLWVWTKTDSFSDVLKECKRVIAVAWLEDGLDYREYRFWESFEVVDTKPAKTRTTRQRRPSLKFA
jgi:hypothetical protein